MKKKPRAVIERDTGSVVFADVLTLASGTAAPLSATPGRITSTHGFIIKADTANTGIAYIGGPGASVAEQSYPLAAGEALPQPLKIEDLANVYGIGSAAGQKIKYIAT